MKRTKFSLSVFAGLMLCASATMAQVEYKIDYLTATESYQVSLVPHQTWESPNNLTATGQITIKVPSGDFDVYDIHNLQDGVEWEANSRFDAPDEAADYDYISFGLKTMGTKGISYEVGQEIPLFLFKNNGDCSGEITLVDNENDPFLPPNSRKANIGNQLTILGAKGNAYIGNVNEGKANCATISNVQKTDNKITSFEVYPNPAKDKLYLEIDWVEPTETIQVEAYNILGKQVMTQKSTFVKGQNTLKLGISHLPEGAYVIKIKGDNWEKTLPKFTKLK